MGEIWCIFIHCKEFAQIFRRLRRAKKSRGAAPRTLLDPHPVTIMRAWSDPTVVAPGSYTLPRRAPKVGLGRVLFG